MSAKNDKSRTNELELLARYYQQQGLNELAQEIFARLDRKDEQHNVVDMFESEERRA